MRWSRDRVAFKVSAMFEYASAADCASLESDDAWFVYLLPSLDCSVFKIGFSYQPLQRIYSFNPRYFECFDLDQALLLRFAVCEAARKTESSLKNALSAHRADSPSWVRDAAGGRTEWFYALEFPHAAELLRASARSDAATGLIEAADFIRDMLERRASAFESWAVAQAQRLRSDFVSVSLGYERTEMTESLRDWLDAYRFFDVTLFRDEPQVLAFVTQSACVFR